LKEVDSEEFFAERERSRKALKDMEAELVEKRPLSEVDKLKKALEEAIGKEAFEEAAEIRDRIRDLEA
jgi:protein-arginine kinase activator protein McsA